MYDIENNKEYQDFINESWLQEDKPLTPEEMKSLDKYREKEKGDFSHLFAEVEE